MAAKVRRLDMARVRRNTGFLERRLAKRGPTQRRFFI